MGGHNPHARVVTVKNGYFDMSGGAILNNNYTAGDGGAVNLFVSDMGTNNGRFTMSGGIISGNSSASYGGAVCCISGSVTLNGGTITNNSTVNRGGGVYVDNGFIVIRNDTLISNNKANSGAGLYLYDTDCKMEGGRISGNVTEGGSSTVHEGGGVFYNGLSEDSGALFYMTGGEISNNTALQGGGIYFDDGYAELKSGIIKDNNADMGGGIFIKYNTLLEMDGICISGDFKITGNHADSMGGGIYHDSVSSVCPMYLGGRIVIAGNTKGSNGHASDLYMRAVDTDTNMPLAVSGSGCPGYSRYGVDAMDVSPENHAWIGLDSNRNYGNSEIPAFWVAIASPAYTSCFFSDNDYLMAGYRYQNGTNYGSRLIVDETSMYPRDYLRLIDVDINGEYVPEDAVVTKDTSGRYVKIQVGPDSPLYDTDLLTGDFTGLLVKGSGNTADNFSIVSKGMTDKRDIYGNRVFRYTYFVECSKTVDSIPYDRDIEGATEFFLDTYWTVDVSVSPVACVLGEYYDTFEEAAEAAGTSEQINLLMDADYAGLTAQNSPMTVWRNGYILNVTTPEGFNVYRYEHQGRSYYSQLFYGQTVSTTGEMIANFYVTVPEELIGNESGYTVSLTYTGESGETVRTLPLSEGRVKNGFRVFSIEIPVKEMGETITAIIRDGNDSIVSGKTYSVARYYDNMITGEHSDDMKVLAASALRYGAAAQKYFDWNTDGPADACLSEETEAQVLSELDIPSAPAVKDPSWNVISRNDTIDGFDFYAQSLLFKAETVLRFYIKTTDGSAVTDYSYSWTDDTLGTQRTAAVPQWSEVHQMYYVEVPGIAARNIGNVFTVYAEKDGATETKTYSPLTYIYSKYDSSDEDLQALVKSMYVYYLAAKAYADSIE